MIEETWTIRLLQDGAWFIAIADGPDHFEARRPTAEQARAEVLNSIKREAAPTMFRPDAAYATPRR